MHHGIRPVLRENTVQSGAVADIRAFEEIARRSGRLTQRSGVSGIGQLVHVDDDA
jgi:hypothetical protein